MKGVDSLTGTGGDGSTVTNSAQPACLGKTAIRETVD
jgi:hypothetical protein